MIRIEIKGAQSGAHSLSPYCLVTFLTNYFFVWIPVVCLAGLFDQTLIDGSVYLGARSRC